jgi:hypothetical protein
LAFNWASGVDTSTAFGSEPVSYCCPYDATHVDDRVWIVEGSSGLSFIAFTHVLT